jgi:hypothetical protein
MHCPNCGNEIEDAQDICPHCDISVSTGRTQTMSGWQRRKSEERRQHALRSQEEIDKKVADRMEKMEAEQVKIGLDRMIADLEANIKPQEDADQAEPIDENISMGPTARLTEKDLDELISILTKDKKKQVRHQMAK